MENFDTVDHINEKAGMCVGYALAYTTDKVIKISLVYKGYKIISRIANNHSVKDISSEELFNRSIDAVADQF